MIFRANLFDILLASAFSSISNEFQAFHKHRNRDSTAHQMIIPVFPSMTQSFSDLSTILIKQLSQCQNVTQKTTSQQKRHKRGICWLTFSRSCIHPSAKEPGTMNSSYKNNSVENLIFKIKRMFMSCSQFFLSSELFSCCCFF